MATSSEPEGFGAFFRRYTKTWMHAVATAGLTAFGTLTFVHRGFVVLALACYVVPPVVLYLSRKRSESTGESTSPTEAALADRDESPSAGSEPEPGPETASEPAAEAAATGAEPEPTPAAESAARVKTGRDPGSTAELERESTSEREPSAETAGAPEPEPEPESGDAEDEPDAEPGWRIVDAPTEATLLDAAVAGSSAIAVGEGGIVLARDSETDDWTVALEDGPAARGQTLYGVDATEDGTVAWIAGDGGAVGRLEVGSGRHADYSAPSDRTDNLAGVAVAGSSGDETVLLINGSGEVLRGRYRDGDLEWDEPVKPGSGSSLSDATLVDASVGYCCDTNDGVFETDDGGRTFETVGLEGADGTLTGIAAAGAGDCHACTDAGVVHRYDGSTWTPERVGEAALSAIARRGDRLVVCDEAGAVYERAGRSAEWERAGIDSSAGLEGVAVGPGLAIAVGADGTVFECR